MAGNPVKEKKKYLTIYQGKIVQRADVNTPNAVKRTNKNGEDVYELIFESFSAEIKDIYVEDTEWGEQCRVLLSDMGDEYVLNFPTDGSNFDSFAKKSPNVKPNVYYTIKPYDFTPEGGKRQVGVNLFYDSDKKVETAFTKDNNGGMPDFPKDKDKRKIAKWSIDKTAFLVEVVKENGLRIKGKSVGVPPVGNAPEVEDDLSDLPF